MLSQEQLIAAQSILQSVVENGRVEQLDNGDFNPESICGEVEFEATERGREDASDLAAWAKAQYE